MGRQGRKTQPDRVRAAQEGQGRIHAGRVAGVHGLKGELKVDSSVPAADLKEVTRVWLTWKDRDEARALTVTGIRQVTAGARRGIDRVLLATTELTDRTAAEALPPGAWVWVDATELPPEDEDALYGSDLLGLTVCTGDGAVVGTVSGFDGSGQGRMQVSRPDGRTVEIPATEPIVREVDLAAGRILVDLPEGLLDL